MKTIIRESFVHGFHFTLIPLLSLTIFTVSLTVGAQPTKEAIESYFASLDSTFLSISKDKTIRTGKPIKINKALKSFSSKNPQFTTLIRTNKKGMVTNELVNGVIKKKKRNIGRQTWFKDLAKSSKPYYGDLADKRKGHLLFWARAISTPIKGKKKKAFKGVLASKIELKTCFVQILEDYDIYFAVKMKERVLFSHLDSLKPGTMHKTDLTINGLSDLTLEYWEPKKEPDKDSIARAAELKRLAEERAEKEKERKRKQAKLEKNVLTSQIFIGVLIAIPVLAFIFGVIYTLIKRRITKWKIDRDKF